MHPSIGSIFDICGLLCADVRNGMDHGAGFVTTAKHLGDGPLIP